MSEDWISAAEAIRLVEKVSDPHSAPRAICSRAYAGLVEAKAASLIKGDSAAEDVAIPKKFWWAKGEVALEQNWTTGDFETYIDKSEWWRAFGVSFRRHGIDAMVGPALLSRIAPPTGKGGRSPADWWEDLWIEMCRQLYVGPLVPKKQSEIEDAMSDWLSSQELDAAESTIRKRARKLWTALNKVEN